MRRRLLDPLLIPARVHSVRQPAPRLRHIVLSAPALAGLTSLPGQQVRVQVGSSPAAMDWLVGTLRTYSVWRHDADTIELIVFDHGHGPGASWARAAHPGDQLRLLKPEGNFLTGHAGYHLFAGEETAQVAFGAMLQALPADATVFARIEVDTPDERLHLANPERRHWDVDWIYRAGRPAAAAQSLVTAVRDLDLPGEPGMAYLAGEARTIQLIRRHLVEERGWPRRNVRTKPFWAPGRTGMD